MSKSIRDRAPKHRHSKAQNRALKCCVICMNVTMHEAQCKGADCGATFYHQETN